MSGAKTYALSDYVNNEESGYNRLMNGALGEKWKQPELYERIKRMMRRNGKKRPLYIQYNEKATKTDRIRPTNNGTSIHKKKRN